jgi:hypothetical protein
VFYDGLKYFLLCIEVYFLLFLVLFSHTEKIKSHEIYKQKLKQEMYKVYLENRTDPKFIEKLDNFNR